MDFVSRLKKIQIQGATNITVESLKHLSGFSRKYGFGKKFDTECKKLLEARPTAVDLFNAIEKVKKSRSQEGINKVIKELEASKTAAAGNASRIFKRSVVLTHCHSSFVVAALVKNKSKIKEVIVTETRPRDQGLITAKELLKNKVKVSYIIDSAISDFIGNADMVVVGADALRNEGLINKVGTHPLAVVAKENRKPFYVITSSFTVDKRPKIVMEQRPASELHANLKGARIFNPAFDLTPWKYITAVITEKGVKKMIR
ncbi:MAG: hypothetical protein J4400_04470 [Candidatus Aenigmarchaeota archaeon]|uniref:R15P Isomerase n=1 Tax=uncultured Aenigmarchaeota archaeon TaxID=1462426 RepID=A0A447IU96_9ARCH|nr:hypothetical protein [Candidatus Aenigmarchaeota archaeon]VDS11082.1 R15P Isomerase [uncultured Aenigmarchaeota archaeon]